MECSAGVAGIIVADDDPMICSVLRGTFMELNQNVFLAADGLEAVKLASLIHASLIILDLKMPKLNGLLACERIRLLPGNAQTPIVILTSTQSKDAQLAGARVGASAFFTKPFRPALLLQALLPYLSLDEATTKLVRRNAERASQVIGAVRRVADHPAPAPDVETILDRDKRVLQVLRH